MRLGRLTPEQSAEMTSAILSGRRESPALDRALYGLSGGNPGMLEGLLRLLAMRGRVSGCGPRWAVRVAPSTLPRALDDLIDVAQAGERTDRVYPKLTELLGF